MSITADHIRQTKNLQTVKELISKKYFTRTQNTYLKIYGNDDHYLLQLANLMNHVQRKKLMKIVEQVKSTNSVFRKYLQNKLITRLRIEDALEFQGCLQTQSKRITLSNVSNRNDNGMKQLNNDIIRIGFMMVLQKLANDRLNNFINETKYIKQTFQRENYNLNRMGFQYVGLENQRKGRDLNWEIQMEEKENGNFKLIGSKIREQTQTIFQTSEFLRSIIQK